jgi:hypothetical protein
LFECVPSTGVPPQEGGMKTAVLQAEWHAALAGLELEDARLLARHGLNVPALVDIGSDEYAVMVGALPMVVEGQRWWPDPCGHRGFVTPVRGRGDARDLLADEIVINGPLIDLVAWHPEAPQRGLAVGMLVLPASARSPSGYGAARSLGCAAGWTGSCR